MMDRNRASDEGNEQQQRGEEENGGADAHGMQAEHRRRGISGTGGIEQADQRDGVENGGEPTRDDGARDATSPCANERRDEAAEHESGDERDEARDDGVGEVVHAEVLERIDREQRQDGGEPARDSSPGTCGHAVLQRSSGVADGGRPAGPGDQGKCTPRAVLRQASGQEVSAAARTAQQGRLRGRPVRGSTLTMVVAPVAKSWP